MEYSAFISRLRNSSLSEGQLSVCQGLHWRRSDWGRILGRAYDVHGKGIDTVMPESGLAISSVTDRPIIRRRPRLSRLRPGSSGRRLPGRMQPGQGGPQSGGSKNVGAGPDHPSSNSENAAPQRRPPVPLPWLRPGKIITGKLSCIDWHSGMDNDDDTVNPNATIVWTQAGIKDGHTRSSAFFLFTCATTIGYGDFVPATKLGKIFTLL